MAGEYAGVVSLPFDREVPYLGGSDFPAFYGGTKLFLDDPANAYDPDSQLQAILEAKGYGREHEEAGSAWYRYYNPPAYSLLLSPLTLLDLQTAFAVTLAINLAGLALLLRVLSTILAERRTIFYIAAAAVVTSVPVNYAFWHAQPTLFLAAFLGLALIAAEKGSPMRAGFFWSLLFAKPHWLVLPAPFVARRDPRSLVSLIAVGLAVLLPFAIVGVEGTRDYLRLLVGRGASDVSDPSFAEAVLSWPGFLRGLTGEARPQEALIMSALTVVFALLVYRRGWRGDFAPLASTLAMVIVVPHSHPQDWIMLAPAAALFLRSQSGLTLAISTALLISIYAGLDVWSTDRGDGETYWPTLFAFGLLVWTYMLSELQASIGTAQGRHESEAQAAA